MLPNLERIFEAKVLDKLRPLPLDGMQRTVYKLLAGFNRRHILPVSAPEPEITFGQLGFRESAPPFTSFFPLQGSLEWLAYPKNTRKENWVVIPIRGLTPCERALPSLKSLLLVAAAPIDTNAETIPHNMALHFQSATAHARSATIGLGYAAVAIPNARYSLEDTALYGQAMKMELVKF